MTRQLLYSLISNQFFCNFALFSRWCLWLAGLTFPSRVQASLHSSWGWWAQIGRLDQKWAGVFGSHPGWTHAEYWKVSEAIPWSYLLNCIKNLNLSFLHFEPHFEPFLCCGLKAKNLQFAWRKWLFAKKKQKLAFFFQHTSGSFSTFY